MARTGVRSAGIIIRNENILLMHRIKNGNEYWVCPGGGVEDTETKEAALVREIKEETNLDVIKYTLLFVDKKDEIEQPYYLCEVTENEAKIIGEENERNSEDNFYELQWIPTSKIASINLIPENVKEKLILYFSTKNLQEL